MATPTLAVICLELALAFAAGFTIVALMVAPPRECPGARCRHAPGPTRTGALHRSLQSLAINSD
jgi:hypothetical protein